ncbi:MAG: SoxR reducing system RseC family protein [Firmicutes bacterium]|nr:SoxR reducing system RseC family protein [Bacillota bacterium]
MKEECVITKVKGGTAYIALAQQDKCGGCRLCAFGRGKKVVLPAIMDAPCKAGDTVIAEMPTKETAFSLFLFIIPLVFLGLGFFVGGFIHDIARVAGALVFCAAAVAVCVPIERAFRRRREFMPVIIEVIDNTKPVEKAENAQKSE